MPPNEQDWPNRWLKFGSSAAFAVNGFPWRVPAKSVKKKLIADDNFNFWNIAFCFFSGGDRD